MPLSEQILAKIEFSMILAIDIGNSNIVFGVSNQDKWINIWRIQTDWLKTADEYEVIFRSLFDASGISGQSIHGTILSSVVPGLIRPFREMIVKITGSQPVLLDPSIYAKLPVRVLNPEEIGTDLVADATAAFVRYQGPCMVIDFGTALTFTTIDRSGEIVGVAIAPGLQTALKSLTENTAQLFNVQLQAPPSVLGKNTINAIQSGIVFGFSGLVDSMIDRTERELGEKLTVISTGGLAKIVGDCSQKINLLDENLTLDGLVLIKGLL